MPHLNHPAKRPGQKRCLQSQCMESSKKGARTGGPNPSQKHILVSLAALPGLCADSLPPIAPQKFFPFPCRRSAAGGIVQGRKSLRTPNAGAMPPRGDYTGAAAPTYPNAGAPPPPGDCTGTAVPTYPQCRRSAAGGCTGTKVPTYPQCRRSALHPGDFLPDEKVTKESPRGGTLWVLPFRGTLSLPLRHSRNPLDVMST